jgi:RNA polymerase-interacting CarD/CdnL/TRCF family regulator
MEYQIGDPVMHWTYGLGNIIGIEERVISEEKKLYYAVGIKDLTVWVPVDVYVENRLRPPSSAAKFKRLLGILTEPGIPLPDDRQERKVQIVEELKDGRAESLCKVVRDLSFYQQVRPLNETDQSLMKRARNALLDEWSFVLLIPLIEAETELRRLLAVSADKEESSTTIR